MRRANVIRAVSAGIWAFAAVALAGSAQAQQAADPLSAARCEDDNPSETLRSPEASSVRNHCIEPRSQFDLGGIGDFAGASARLAAPDVTTFVTNTGPSDSGKELQGQTLPFYVTGDAENLPTWQNFELQFVAAASRGDWLRNKEVAPSLQNATGGGWATVTNTQRLGGRHYWQGHDGSAGVLHSGVQAETGAGCLDHGGGYPGYPDGFPLLAASDCPQTWGSAGWQGRTPIEKEGWENYFSSVGGESFSWDFWKVPDAFQSEDKQFIGDFQVFGRMSDHGSDHLRQFGSVVPGQSGDPQVEGYPIGLDVWFNAYSFGVPSVSRGFIWEGLIINASEEVYGVPLDYDSLYFGMMIRPLRSNGGGRRANPHAIEELGVVVHNELGRTEDCNGAIPVPQSIGCGSPRGRTPGFTGGAEAHLILKSPIGDLRNKLFTRTTTGRDCVVGRDPFCAPNHPNAGDTITFNRMSMCDYRCSINQFQSGDVRRGFGLIAAQPLQALDGRDPRSDLSAFDNFMLFHTYTNPEETFCDAAANPRGPGCFGWWVPGATGEHPEWTYSNRPPGAPTGPDTLFIDNCRPPTSAAAGANECTAIWADTLPNKYLNWTQNVIYPIAGPFPLAAGDTTSFVVANLAAPDSTGLMSGIGADISSDGTEVLGQSGGFIDFYMKDFFLGPGQPDAPGIVSASTSPGSRNLDQTEVDLFIDDSAERWQDAFALKIIEEMNNPSPGTFFDNVVSTDPTAPDRLQEIVESNNVTQILIFKSCDDGQTFTSSTREDCPRSPARDELGQPVGFGWQAYGAMEPDENGSFPSVFEDAAVTAGQEYIYSFVSITEGIQLETQYTVSGEVRDTLLEIVPAGRNQLSTNLDKPNVIKVYVPASRSAGTTPARAELLSQTGPVLFESGQVEVQFLDEGTSETGRWRLVFGSGGTVSEYLDAEGGIDSTVVTLDQSVNALMPDGSVEELPAGTRALTSRSSAGVTVKAPGAVTSEEVEGGVTVRRTVIDEKAGVFVDQGDSSPLFVSTVMDGTGFTPQQYFSHPAFGDFVVRATDEPGGFFGSEPDSWLSGQDTLRTLRSRSFPSVEWLEDESDATDELFHRLDIEWADEVFQPPLPQMNVRNPAETRQAVLDNVAGRQAGSSTVTSDAAVTAINNSTGLGVTADDLLSIDLPFRVTDPATGNEVQVAMLRDSKAGSVLLGSGIDTTTLEVPDDVWWPGEPVILLEEVPLAQTDGDGDLIIEGGEPVIQNVLRATWSEAIIGCDSPQRTTCNPIGGPGTAGSPGYVHVRPEGNRDFPAGWTLRADYLAGFSSRSTFELETRAAVTGDDVTDLGEEGLDAVRVVPNPYVGSSAYEFLPGDIRRIMFTHLPPEGTIRIFTASGQFVQELRWTPDMLRGNGDLYYDLQTREGNRLAAGLYVYVVEALGQKAIKKFIVIR